ncbi:uncharacterized protein BDCG_17256 [Blastomyces dermatitidis ER-3]|uniref:Uncharacterized protein n=3 Tax=Blastomyces TaxID=229219 RepID=A0A179U925_BLAGS|nr:uncharacterized protein BDBG_16206 [Blastomyces gilchristii SLH14081]XP_045281577.1 uncharacterized protein BDCG_17256 [Blastomyces dermatitidis ER-3]EQL36171.1 hypothetical protein BDFG_02410 [Blastomyces dermatitidis ATCC 26199]KMW67735.1 hypothetical protein BDDG_12284 [Blastomyces dermatitidis ATCC 18188]OAT01850.1 hypothetical protein BDCG_17256 [Blastomyces dermatitidis ER-3]OAT04233.1 hypothetical protein BDBG_16206 [Blastomyces gilchristii SLH14081]
MTRGGRTIGSVTLKASGRQGAGVGRPDPSRNQWSGKSRKHGEASRRKRKAIFAREGGIWRECGLTFRGGVHGAAEII